jgi:tetratricopeptide (TPR) repeat protein
MRLSFRFLSLLVLISSVLVLMHPDDSLAGTCEKAVARMVSAQGIVQVKRVGETQWQQVKLNETYCPGDVIQVGERSRADVALINQPVLRLDQNTVITLGGVKEERTSIIALIKGAAHFFSRVTRGLEVQTAFVNAGVEGTEFFIRVEKDKTVLSVFEGKVLASNAEGSLAITGGQSAEAEAGKAPVARVVVHPRDAVQWALYYPPVVYEHPENLKENDPRFYTTRASSLLQVGRVDEAKADLERALKLDPNSSVALALQSIIAVTQNEKETALDLAGKAVQSNPNSAEAHIALSYAQQANFNLEGALSSVKEAVRVQPENALAWARLAELQLSFGRLNDALNAAQKAVTLNPDISRTQTVLGFALLTEVRTGEAKRAFEKAIELDQADPLPRLGLGLSKIREGELDEGGRDIEIAASLDPNNSLVRSYLGKTFFEEKRTKKSSEEYGISKELDPSDPTPYFYDAILKQTTNRPVEALHDMEKAIELNDNRAVYRSQLLLDSDLAARSASLARVYSDLGFQQLALVEGWKSENTDPSNFSAHRFLADSYSALPRHEIARVSELLQSQLLQPINITPIQPHLSESNLFVVSGGGPAAASFNEFNPLFNRNGYALQVNGIVGENNTFGEEIVASGIYNKASFSVGQYHFKTDGWRTNANQNDNIVNAFLQYELSPETSVQAEYRYRDNKTGDLQLRFFPEDVNVGETITERKNTFRLGARHAFSTSSVVLASFIYTHADLTDHDHNPVVAPGILNLLDAERPEDAYSGEVQYLFSSRYVNITAGVGYTTIDGEITSRLGFVDPPIIIENPAISTDLQHTNGYAYSYIKPLNNLTLTVGASVDFTDGDSPDVADKKRFNPKFGITWNPLPNTTVRAAVFRVLKRTLITDQTLEPTQVAGLNQFFDDLNGTDAWRYGAAVDQQFSENIFGGVEFSKRDLDVPAVDIVSGDPIRVDWDESLVRAYFFWTPYRWIGLRAEYQYEKVKRDLQLTDGVRDMETHRFPLGLSFYHPSGVSVSLTTTYYRQQGTFEHINIFEGLESGKDDFWLVDAAINYRLPKRYGFITVGAKNLFDKDFNYYDLDWKNPSIHPGRFLFARIALALP